jgi:hypothetical protein
MKVQNGQTRDTHAKRSGANGVNRLAETFTAPPLEPSATAAAGAPPGPKAEGRDTSSGRFTAGNRFGKGNPHARRMAALREAFLSAATEERMRELGETLYAAAVGGDWQAAKLFLLFVVGRPADAVDPDALDREEWKHCQEWPEEPFSFAWLRKRPFAEAVQVLQTMSELGKDKVVRVYPPEGVNADD